MVASKPAPFDANAVDPRKLTECQGALRPEHDASQRIAECSGYEHDDASTQLRDQLTRLDLGGDRLPGRPAIASSKASLQTCQDAAPAAFPAQSPGPAAERAAAAPAPLLPSMDLAGVADMIRSGKARRIVVMAGAGISVSAGIPDFRTPGTGLYSQLQRYRLPYPEAVFSIEYFRRDPKPFYTLAKELFPGGYAPTPAHFLLRMLADRGLLLRVFTQNIDGLEQLAGVPPERVVAAHGSFDGARCIDCKRPASMYAVQAAVYDDGVCACDSCGGLVKPDIVFFGEPLPARFHRRRAEDMPNADLLIVMGTSLVVQPFASMIGDVGEEVPRLLINRERVGHSRTAKALEARDAGHQRRQAASKAPANGGGSSSSCVSSSDDDDAGSPEDDWTSQAAAGGGAEDGSSGDSGADSDDSSGSGLSGGFDWGVDGNRRDAVHLGDSDDAARQLAALLGWRDELEALIAEDAAARLEAAKEQEGEW